MSEQADTTATGDFLAQVLRDFGDTVSREAGQLRTDVKAAARRVAHRIA